MKIRGKQASSVRARLGEFFSEAGYAGPSWYLFLANGRTMPLRDLLGGSRSWIDLRASISRGLPALVRVQIPEATIRVKNNVRLFYADPRHGGDLVAAKVTLPSEVRADSLAREIRARKVLPRAAPALPIPAIIRYDRKNLHWLIETYIRPAKKTSNSQKIGVFLANHAVDLYGPCARSRPVSDWLRRRRVTPADLKFIFDEAGVELPESALHGTWPVSLLHGDLSPGNMVAGEDGQVHLVDWEKFTVGPVASDMKKLVLQAPALVENLLHELSRPGDVDPVAQMQIALALELVRRRRDRAGLAAYVTSHLGKKSDQSSRFLDEREREIMEAIAGLAGRAPVPMDSDSVAAGTARIAKALESLGAYSRIPDRLQKMYPDLVPAAKEDKFGATDRLAAIEETLKNRNLGTMIDLGGNAGYFSLSLVDSGMASGSTVYDSNPEAIAAGRLMAKELGLDDKVAFVARSVDLDFVRALGSADTIVCLNLLHHAGALFDMDSVIKSGWEAYAREWLVQLRTKTELAILGLGFKSAKPPHWKIAPDERAKRFGDLARATGWHIGYDANIEDLRSIGIQAANGLRTRNTEAPLGYSGLTSDKKELKAPSLLSKYHLYILQRH
jgi:hypothetical protein